MQGDILAQGMELMVYGMGTVVVFLGLLVLTTSAMSLLVARYFPEPLQPLPSPPGDRRSPGEDEGRIVAAISAAIHLHRSKRQ